MSKVYPRKQILFSGIFYLKNNFEYRKIPDLKAGNLFKNHLAIRKPSDFKNLKAKYMVVKNRCERNPEKIFKMSDLVTITERSSNLF